MKMKIKPFWFHITKNILIGANSYKEEPVNYIFIHYNYWHIGFWLKEKKLVYTLPLIGQKRY